MQDLSDELNVVFKLLEEDPALSRISPDGKRLYIMVEGEVICVQGPQWNDLTEEQINTYLEKIREDAERELKRNRDSQ